MNIKTIFIFLTFSFNLAIVSQFSYAETEKDTETITASELLNDYYKEFKKTSVPKDKCDCYMDLTPKQYSLGKFYSDYTKHN